ncbi:MAG TPA: hypothetical protein VLB83_00365 [Candidatus Paceibacterota bacterium]|nr:hypothetical protein [Candidatus Paceibacterota bacterium]
MKDSRTPFVRVVCASTLALVLLSLPLSALALSPAAPFATTYNATFVTENSFYANGKVNGMEMSDTEYWFEWGMNSRSGVVYETTHLRSGGYHGDVSVSVVGLAPSTQYFFRLVAENSRGKDIGQTVFVNTKALPSKTQPITTILALDAKSITETTATFRSYVSPHGGSPASAWYEWGETAAFGKTTQKYGFGVSSSAFDYPATGLTPGTTYFYRAVAETTEGRYYSAIISFTTRGTPPPPPVVAPAPTPATTPGTQASSGNTAPAQVVTTGSAQTGSATYVEQGGSSRLVSASPPSPSFGATASVGSAAPTVVGTGVPPNPITELFLRLFGKGTATSTEGLPEGPEGVIVSIATSASGSGARVPVEYRVTYENGTRTTYRDAMLRVIYPADVIYIGDNTDNELLLEENPGPERTYVLAIGTLSPKEKRTITLLGMTTSDAKQVPVARARLEITSPSGERSAVAAKDASGATAAARAKASASDGDGGILPNTFLEWLIFVIAVLGIILGVRAARTFYEKRKQEIAEEEAARDADRRMRTRPIAEYADPSVEMSPALETVIADLPIEGDSSGTPPRAAW